MACFIVLVCALLLGNNGVEGSRKLSREEELDLEKQLKLLNKPAVKTIHTEHGDIYDCVDFYKQPAFDHPLLKKHNFHPKMRPSAYPKWTRHSDSSTVGKPLKVGLKGGGCPEGTVPITRTTKDDLIRAKLFTEIYASNINPHTADNPGFHYAVARTKIYLNKKYMGVGANMSIYNPKTNASQYSAGVMKIKNGPDSIQVGWMVNPGLYKDNKTRLFTFLNAGASQCFNTLCPGFVYVDTGIPLDLALEPVSRRGGATYHYHFFLLRDSVSGKWWLELGEDRTPIGFWPQSIFTGLTDLASFAEWGGEVFSPPALPSPPMGSGYFPIGITRFDGFTSNIVVVNESNWAVMPENTETYADNEDYYKVWDVKDNHDIFGYLVLYGGRGGITGK